MVKQTTELYYRCLVPLKLVGNTKLETYHQDKILRYLEGMAFQCIKTIVTNRAGNADIVACSPTGQFWKIEVKKEKGEASKLQLAKLKLYYNNEAICMVAYGFDDFLYKHKLLYTNS